MDIAIEKLELFLQYNFTGPFENKLNIDTKEKKSLITILEIDGEYIYQLTRNPELLEDAIQLFENQIETTIGKLWLMRSLFIHQRLLENASSTLYTRITDLSTQIIDNLNQLPIELANQFHIELSLIYHFYKKEILVDQHLTLAASKIDFKFKLTGALGKRTKHQTFEIVQLVVDALPSSSPSLSSTHTPIAPMALDLNDDTLLEKISFTDPRFHVALNPIDQSILLAHCITLNTNPVNGLSAEEMMSYVDRVLENPVSWLVHSFALLLRSRLESTKTRTVERSALQHQALVDQTLLELPLAKERLACFFIVLMPPLWDLERELGERLVSLGVVVSAMEIFKRLEMWEDVVGCLRMMEKDGEAIEIVESQLKSQPNAPKYLCMLGDLKGDEVYFHQAWEKSGFRYARAMRSLGAVYFKKQDFTKCIEYYGKALALNPLFENSWFVLGCAAMHIKEYDTAVMAFIKVVNIDFDNGEAWTNLASVYIKQGKKIEAYRALKEALKLMYDNTKIWQNFLYCSIDVLEITDVIIAYKRCVELSISKAKSETFMDIEILDIMVKMVVEDLMDADNLGSSKHVKALVTLLNYLTSVVSNSVALYNTCSTLYKNTNKPKLAIEYLQKAYRVVLNNPGMNLEEGKFVRCVDATLKLVDGLIEMGLMTEVNRFGVEEVCCKDYIYQAKMSLKSVMGRCKDWDEHVSYQHLVDCMNRLNASVV